MNKRIDRFLLGLLWLLATTLGANFWFNTKFGFNIFFASHWEYLGQLQASKAEISPLFYTSMVIIVFLMLSGLYLIVRPRFRKINFQENTPSVIEDEHVEKPMDIVVSEPEEIITSVIPAVRPPRLSIPTINNYTAQHKPVEPITPVTPVNTPINGSEEIEEIFKKAGYLVKKPTKIGNFVPNLFAIGSDEVLWIGAVDIEQNKLSEAIEKLRSIFTETLEDIEINIKSFIIKSKIGESDFPAIEKFDSLTALSDFISKNPNREITDSEKEDFEAYSEYIDTVADYFKKA